MEHTSAFIFDGGIHSINGGVSCVKFHACVVMSKKESIRGPVWSLDFRNKRTGVRFTFGIRRGYHNQPKPEKARQKDAEDASCFKIKR